MPSTGHFQIRAMNLEDVLFFFYDFLRAYLQWLVVAPPLINCAVVVG